MQWMLAFTGMTTHQNFLGCIPYLNHCQVVFRQLAAPSGMPVIRIT
jgi:hypothetical protein